MKSRLAVALVAAALASFLALSCKRHPHPAPAPSGPTPSTAAAASPLERVQGAEDNATDRAPDGYERATVWQVVSTGDGAAVLVIDASQTTVLPIFVGGSEALTIQLRVDGKHFRRPLTHDLLSTLVFELGGTPTKVQIDDMRENTFYGSIFVRQGDHDLKLDARPSDAIALSLGSGAPLFVSRAVMHGSGVRREDVEKELQGRDLGKPKSVDPIAL